MLRERWIAGERIRYPAPQMTLSVAVAIAADARPSESK